MRETEANYVHFEKTMSFLDGKSVLWFGINSSTTTGGPQSVAFAYLMGPLLGHVCAGKVLVDSVVRKDLHKQCSNRL